MAIKRSPSQTPSSTEENDTPPKTPTPKKQKTSETPTTPKTPKTSNSKQENGTWDNTKKAAFMDDIIAAGYKSADLDVLAGKYGLSKRQLVDQLVPNKGGNLRGVACKAVGGPRP